MFKLSGGLGLRCHLHTISNRRARYENHLSKMKEHVRIQEFRQGGPGSTDRNKYL